MHFIGSDFSHFVCKQNNIAGIGISGAGHLLGRAICLFRYKTYRAGHLSRGGPFDTSINIQYEPYTRVAVAIQNDSTWPFAFAAAQPASRTRTPNAPSCLVLRHLQDCMLARHDAGGWLGPLGLCRMRRLSLHRCGRDSHGESMKASRATGLGSYRIPLNGSLPRIPLNSFSEVPTTTL